MPSLLIFIPLLGVIALNLLTHRMKQTSLWFAGLLFAAQIVMTIFYRPVFYDPGLERINEFFKLHFLVDNLSLIMLLCIGVICLASLAVGIYTLKDPAQRFYFNNLLIIASIGMNGIVMTRDLFSLYVFLEISAVASFILISFRHGRVALEGAFKYIILSGVATIFLLASIALFFMAAGGTSFFAIHEAIRQSGHSPLLVLAMGIFLCGLFIKGGVVPFHAWLPDAYIAAPVPVTVLLAGAMTKVCGLYTLIRFFTTVYGMDHSFSLILLFLGCVSIFVGALAAMGQNDFKRMLAYSSISQMGYIVLSLGAGTPLGLAGAVFHFLNHAVFKSLLFVNAAAVRAKLGTYDMDQMGGLSAKMPITGTTSVLGFLSASGIPPLAGFWSKLIIVIALWQAGHTGYAVLAILASILTLAYFLIMQRKIFFGKLNEEWKDRDDIREMNPGFSFIAVCLAALALGMGLFFPYVYVHLIEPVKEILL